MLTPERSRAKLALTYNENHPMMIEVTLIKLFTEQCNWRGHERDILTSNVWQGFQAPKVTGNSMTGSGIQQNCVIRCEWNALMKLPDALHGSLYSSSSLE